MNDFDISKVLQHLPQRYPFLLIDRVVEYKKDKSLVAVKNVTINEPFFQGHFPDQPVMPGVLVIEAMAQASGILALMCLDTCTPKSSDLYKLVGVDKARFRRAVAPGDQLKITVSITRKVKGIWKFNATAHVDGELCVSAEIMGTYREAAA
ncbi:MAG: 3-hydroxyacyl-ACP dehydratase FabZ [Acidiferrobacterales bacterium]